MTKRPFDIAIPTSIPKEITVITFRHPSDSQFFESGANKSTIQSSFAGNLVTANCNNNDCAVSTHSIVTCDSFFCHPVLNRKASSATKTLPSPKSVRRTNCGFVVDQCREISSSMSSAASSSQKKLRSSSSSSVATSTVQLNVCHYIRVCQKCGTSGAFAQCSSCKEVHYCSVEHQKADWKQHKTVCRHVASDPVSIFVQVGTGEGNGLTNEMTSHIFHNKRQGLEFIAQNHFNFNDLSRPLRSPFCELLGWNVEIFCYASHQHFFLKPQGPFGNVVNLLGNRVDGVNGAGVFLGCDIDNGISRYQNLDGAIFVTGRHTKTGHPLTQYILWEILDFIYDSMDAYDDEDDRNALSIIEEDARRYRDKQTQQLSSESSAAIDVTRKLDIGANSVDHRKSYQRQENKQTHRGSQINPSQVPQQKKAARECET